MRLKHEKKTRVATMIFTPSVYEAFQKVAYMKHISISSLMEQLMRECCEENAELVKQFEQTYQGDVSK